MCLLLFCDSRVTVLKKEATDIPSSFCLSKESDVDNPRGEFQVIKIHTRKEAVKTQTGLTQGQNSQLIRGVAVHTGPAAYSISQLPTVRS